MCTTRFVTTGEGQPPLESVVTFCQVEARFSRVFMNEQMHWTLQATCAVCLRETTAPLTMGVPVHCVGCGLVMKINPARTTYHRSAAG